MVWESHMLEGCTVTASSEWSLQNLSIFHCWFSAIIAIFLFSMSKQTWGLDWCLAFSRISFSFTQTQDTQGVLLAACVYQIQTKVRQRRHMYSTIFNTGNHLDLTQIHPVKLKGGFTVFVYSADRGLAAWFERATCWRGAPWLRHRSDRCKTFPFSTADFQQS